MKTKKKNNLYSYNPSTHIPTHTHIHIHIHIYIYKRTFTWNRILFVFFSHFSLQLLSAHIFTFLLLLLSPSFIFKLFTTVSYPFATTLTFYPFEFTHIYTQPFHLLYTLSSQPLMSLPSCWISFALFILFQLHGMQGCTVPKCCIRCLTVDPIT